MTSSDELQQAVNEVMESLGDLAVPLRGDVTLGETIFDAASAAMDVPRVSEEDQPRLVLQEKIGEGGMGIVRLATQTSLGRSVAVKMVKAESLGRHSIVKTLQEAWITGSLEHPNIVPIHELYLDAEGSPMIVLKRIEGWSWADLYKDQQVVESLFGAHDLLEWNVQILLEVCQAVRFAHSKGVIHRDIKPENVMIGAFGEVYLVDWGLGVALEPDPRSRIPCLSSVAGLAGTPCYMAPEMLGTTDVQVSKRTDIYLLGATLFECLVGRPPHGTGTFESIVTSILSSPPQAPEGAPEELAHIIERCMQADPAQRFADVEELRRALTTFLRHRGSRDTAARAHLVREEMLEALTSKDAVRAREAFTACAFGFRVALSAWSQNPSARTGLRDATLALAEMELSVGNARSAQNLLQSLEEAPPTDLKQKVDEAIALEDRTAVEMARLKERSDRQTGQTLRVLAFSLVGTAAVLGPFLCWVLNVTIHPVSLAIGEALMLGAAGLFATRTRRKVTTANRSTYGSLGVFASAALLAIWVSHVFGAPVAELIVWIMIVGAVATAMAALLVIPRLWIAALGYSVAAVCAAYSPADHLAFLATANLVCFALLLHLSTSKER